MADRPEIDRDVKPTYTEFCCPITSALQLGFHMTVVILIAALVICMFVFMAMDEKSY